MKSMFAVSLIALLFLPLWGTFGYFSLQKKQVQKAVKRKMMEGIPREELVFMQFTREQAETELNWKHTKEFEFNGEMYDIVERNETTDSVFYWVWWDKEETALNQQVRRLAKEIFGKSPEKNSNDQQVTSFYKSLFIEQTDDLKSTVFKEIFTPCYNYQFSLKTAVLIQLGPPPKQLT